MDEKPEKQKRVGDASSDKPKTSNSINVKEELDTVLREFTVLNRRLRRIREHFETDSVPGPSQKQAKTEQESVNNFASQTAKIESRRATLKLDIIKNINEENKTAHTQSDDVQPGPSRQDFYDLTNDDTEESFHNITIKKERVSTPESVLIQSLFTNPNLQPEQPASTNSPTSPSGRASPKDVGVYFRSKRRDNEKLLNYFTRKLDQGRKRELPDEIIYQCIIENSKDEKLISWVRDTNCNNLKKLYDYIQERTRLEYSIS